MIKDKEEALKMVGQDGMNLRLVSEELQNDREVVLAAIQNTPYAFQFASDALQKDEALSGLIDKNERYYFNMVDPRNGARYDIPLLIPSAPDYYSKYVHFMKIKERSPNTFERILRWD